MLTRRLALASLACLAAGAFPAAASAQTPAKPQAGDPAALLTRLYKAAAKDNAGGAFVNNAKERAKYLSKSLAALWTRAEAKVPDGEIGPIDFDPVSNSQDPDIKSFVIKAERQDDSGATLAVALIGSQRRKVGADGVIRYDLVRDGESWRIDDIRGSAEGQPWSVRQTLEASLKN
ncbi:uncharacterized protein DUF3828 [Rhodopseudomonas thermotolerans]|uniref:Uncharacterized protein DUF3828 n=2 Tax=Rhodopseudomonas TaxID=1073 RepID=A0A336JH19_9BRAD|nr:MULTISPECIES: DUF3828 domain-containing protein [Rhodopseudomonas]RED42447.1 uncharacterized protein DUF3828 [Rhodopseudomonas pentothenatexigens]REG08237.1 uncharacterized protein DUF3828 [Rhodopseudomonas thermotolerans]SSW89048.1 uncharacterized protein DUF3828 [Rhodopseudomonas pentothenatexigens]